MLTGSTVPQTDAETSLGTLRRARQLDKFETYTMEVKTSKGESLLRLEKIKILLLQHQASEKLAFVSIKLIWVL